MTVYFSTDNFEILKFYSYPCSVVERLAEYTECDLNNPCGDRHVKKFFEDCLKQTEFQTCRKSLMDNKIAMEIRHKASNTILYVGYKDNTYCIGLSMHPYMKSSYTIEL